MIPGGGDDPAGRTGLVEWLAYLREIGVRELRVRESSPPARTPVASARRTAEPTAPRTTRGASRSAPEGAASRKPVAPSRAEQPTLAIVSEAEAFPEPAPQDPARALEQVREELGECTRCKLHPGRSNIVFGVGDPRARLMFIGEGPGAEEDARGEPFVGRAGKKLDEMIAAIGLERRQVYIANIVKCRPPNNRDPERDEIEMCSPFLERQISAIRPRVIVTLGAPAARTLLRTKVGITRLRGQWQSYRGIPVMPTYHPAYLLRAYTMENRRKVFEDLKAARARVDE